MAEEIGIIKIVPEGMGGGTGSAGGSAGGTGSAGGSISKGVAGGMSSVLKTLGIGSLIGMLVSALSTIKSLTSMVNSIVKMLGLLLKPVADVVVAFLMPILMILKPIVKALNTIMRPFFNLAMDMMKKGVEKQQAGNSAGAGKMFAGATSVIMGGLESVIITLFGEVLKLIIDSLTGTVAIIVEGFAELLGLNAEGVLEKINLAGEKLKGGIDTMNALAIAHIGGSVADMADQMGVETEGFRKDTRNAIHDVFNADKGLIKKVEDVLSLNNEDGFGAKSVKAVDTAVNSQGGLTQTFLSAFDLFEEKGKKKVSSAIEGLNDLWDKLKTSTDDDIGGDSDSWIGVAADTVAEIGTGTLARTKTWG